MSMNSIEALEWAAEYCDRTGIFKPEMKANGYAPDGWKAPSPSEKQAIILEYAKQVQTEAIPSEEAAAAVRQSLLEMIGVPLTGARQMQRGYEIASEKWNLLQTRVIDPLETLLAAIEGTGV